MPELFHSKFQFFWLGKCLILFSASQGSQNKYTATAETPIGCIFNYSLGCITFFESKVTIDEETNKPPSQTFCLFVFLSFWKIAGAKYLILKILIIFKNQKYMLDFFFVLL